MNDQWNAFKHIGVTGDGPNKKGALSGASFAVKDVFDVKGVVTGAGNPDWEQTHLPATTHAKVVEQLINQGAKLVGTTHTDELMFSLNGENVHYGTPVNPKAPERIPGGSSSGSAVVVAAELVDFAIGTDTGGSVRIPSSYCGVFGIRPTHGAVSMNGVIPLARYYDTVGWMARTPELLYEVGTHLLDQVENTNPFSKVIIPQDVLALVDEKLKDPFANIVEQFQQSINQVDYITLAEGNLQNWLTTFRTLQGFGVWESHGNWIEKVNPNFGSDIAERFKWASTVTEEEAEEARLKREKIRQHVLELLGEDNVILMPTAPGVAPLLQTEGEGLEVQRNKTLQMTCISGLTGFPEVTLPLLNINGTPVGLSIIAGPGQDLRLLNWVKNNITQQSEQKI
ncbi:amidase [Alkalihalobacillus alcalophilus ATCC 27647 = CGMCC 1.3604]|uniref:Amidase n=1 Tax=Alkalihalobacillus alcalophilus ATCC 27647 = CGMCC 1.3604 TaxID=1218173 RepID=A0A094WGR9_ALKAL|nr:amidase [Alkalihalobacillus alcalophilus]KGA95981.1 amidase [Alkalihalobacillus alcalophilus ATCC 27647 = CGMCC 1.3604]MED1562080.1 amidase [Alkalihalobacillus alcalophilus]THG88291.1 amidase [Alkalihalobacillus alcalophilus ATCC 27647 = CGMCC 1.3604]